MVRSSTSAAALVATALVSSSQGFAPVHNSRTAAVATSTQLHFGIPSFLQPQKDDVDDTAKEDKNKQYALPKKDLSLAGLVQVITAGAGAPFLGDYEGVDEETGNFMFSLEANNLVDENGNSKQTQMPFFENGEHIHCGLRSPLQQSRLLVCCFHLISHLLINCFVPPPPPPPTGWVDPEDEKRAAEGFKFPWQK